MPINADLVGSGVILHVSFVGYVPWVDTLFATTPVRCALKPEVTRLEPFVVTGQYAPGSVEGAVQKLRVIDAQRIRRMAANNLGDALRNQLNIRLSQDNLLGSSLSMQGLGGENVKVLIDGVPVTGRQNGNVDLSQLDLTGIERIELVEGPLSVSYGTNALAGTINLITKKSGVAPSTLRASVYTEHIGRLNATLGGSQRWGRNNLLLLAGATSSPVGIRNRRVFPACRHSRRTPIASNSGSRASNISAG
ncbi:MAG: TonB-dependent receptor [Flavobacteriales bacterium]|nr:TonB-dependent receptor [Flavobacteriales bacterium]